MGVTQEQSAVGQMWRFRLYVKGQSELAGNALAIIRKICRERLEGRYQLEMVDIEKRVDAALEDNVVAVPMLVRLSPEPVRRIVGDLTRSEAVLQALNLEDGATQGK